MKNENISLRIMPISVSGHCHPSNIFIRDTISRAPSRVRVYKNILINNQMPQRTDFQIRAEWRYAGYVRAHRVCCVCISSRAGYMERGRICDCAPVLIIPRIIRRFLSLPAPWRALMETRISFETVDNKIPRK